MLEQAVTTTKHEQIRQWILDGIQTGRFAPGDKLPSESELCRQFSVSRNSVRQAINGLIAEGRLESKKGVGTFCLLKSRRLTMDIGLVCFFSGSYIFPRIARGCDQVAHKRGFHLILNQSEYSYEKEREILLKLKKRGLDGLIIEPIHPGSGKSNLDLLTELENTGTPVVLIDNCFPEWGFSRVVMDDTAGGYLVASYLWDRGHRRIGILSDDSYQPKRLRKQGALDLLRDRQSRLKEEWLLDYAGPVRAGGAYRAVDEFLGRGLERPSAFICTSDEESIELFKAADKHGLRVPRDLSVISFDNSELAVLPGISLTSVDHPGQYIGESATNILIERILNPGVASSTVSVIQPRIVERTSVTDIQHGAE